MAVRALVLAGFGINCEVETAAALRLAGADVETVHLNRVLRGATSIHEHDLLAFPGGFSFGDDLGSGKVLAAKLRFARLPNGRVLLDELERFLGDGKRILGICNGFQILVKAGVLPFGTDPAGQERWRQRVTLAQNASGRFEDRWVRLGANPRGAVPWLRDVGAFDVPVRHGEGRLIIGDEDAARRIVEQGLDVLRYLDDEGRPAERHPHNPAGSALAVAGLADPSGQIVGLMPHPEAFLSLFNHPAWPRLRREREPGDEQGQGLLFFQRLVSAMSANGAPP